MFLEDEHAAGRLRTNRVSLSLMIAVIAFACCVVATFGLLSIAEAAPALASGAMREAHADQKITDGVAVLFAAFIAANGLAIWLRRIKGLVLSGGRQNGR